MIYIFDIDGTLADLTHRLHHIQKSSKNWDGFFEACENDKPIEDVAALCRILYHYHTVLLVSGRSDSIRVKTENWLVTNGISFDHLYMRTAGDHREDNVVKSELLDKLIQDHPNERILGVFEDRNQVVKMYRERGLRVYQMAEGDF